MYRPLIAATVLALALFPVISFAAPAKEATTAPFSIPKLSYAYDALEPVIDAKTMETHLTKHHQAYVDKLNGEVKVDKALNGKSLEDIVSNISKYSTTVRNNAGGHWNHTFFWNIMTPASKSGAPSEALTAALTKSFGSVEAFKTAFEKAGTDRFGSGWVWLIADKDGNLSITSTANQDNPLMDDAPVKGTPILANDVWEHAYYLTYQNKRADYLKKWWGVVNWAEVSKNYEAVVAK
jgi:Fe-Mn family superoxide dismutase